MSRVIALPNAPVVFRVDGAEGHEFAGWATGLRFGAFDVVAIDASAFPGLDGAGCFGRLPIVAPVDDSPAAVRDDRRVGARGLDGRVRTPRAGHLSLDRLGRAHCVPPMLFFSASTTCLFPCSRFSAITFIAASGVVVV
jgi:hypothetical protein